MIYYWIRRTATWNLFVLYNNKKPFFVSKYFNITRTPAFCPAFAWKKPFDVIYDIQNEAISLVAMRSKDLWLVQENHATVKLDSSVASREMKTYSKSRIELRKSTNRKENAGVKSVFVIRAAQWAEELGCWLEYCKSWKNTLGKLAIAVNPEAIWLKFWTERSVNDGGNLCPLWSVILKSVWNSVGDTF